MCKVFCQRINADFTLIDTLNQSRKNKLTQIRVNWLIIVAFLIYLSNLFAKALALKFKLFVWL